MRRSEIIEGVNQVIDAIDESSIIKTYKSIFTAQKSSRNVPELMLSFKVYAIAAHNFNSAARRIASILELDFLEDPALWAAVADTTSRVSSRGLEKVVFAKNNLPQIVKLLDREYSNLNKDNSEPIISNGKEMKTLSVTVFESGNIFSSPQRLVNVLESVDTFYTACAFMNDESPDTLSVVACDSGSDKSFDFLGVAKVIECVTQLIENLWDRVVFYREKQLDVRLDLINKSLPIYEKISELQQGEKIERELAERLRRNISDGVNKFIESGASIPEIDVRSTYSSRSLLSPVQKLLVSAPEETTETKDSGNISFDPHNNEFSENKNQFSDSSSNGLNSEEIEKFREFLDKMQNSNPSADRNNLVEESFDEDEG